MRQGRMLSIRQRSQCIHVYTRTRSYVCAWSWRALGSRAARLLFNSATRTYGPLQSSRERCRMRQGTPLSLRKRSRCTHVCACVCARVCGMHWVPGRLGCYSMVLRASTDLSSARGIVVVCVKARRRVSESAHGIYTYALVRMCAVVVCTRLPSGSAAVQ
jgi:hypothetical protein